MNTNNMINPANYYNPFAKYNYTSKTRGVYMPKDSEPLIKLEDKIEKSANIFSDNYDAETDILQSMNKSEKDNTSKSNLLGFISKFFNN